MKPILISFCCAAAVAAHAVSATAAASLAMGMFGLLLGAKSSERGRIPSSALESRPMPFATLNGIRVQYVIQGGGPPLLMFAPGGFRSMISRWTAAGGKREWQEMDGLATLSHDFTCIAYDRRESGLSGGRVEPLNWDVYVREAKELLDLAGAKRALILGSCFGASLALAFAVRHPQTCAGLLLHWPVGGYRWRMKGHSFFRRHIEFVRAHGLAAILARARVGENFWLDPEIGPWG